MQDGVGRGRSMENVKAYFEFQNFWNIEHRSLKKREESGRHRGCPIVRKVHSHVGGNLI
jgi:hypothetical protein